MKLIAVVCVFFAVFIMLPFTAFASEEYYSELFEALPGETTRLLESFGIGEDVYESFGEISPERALEAVAEVFRSGFSQPVKSGAMSIALVFISALVTSLAPENGNIKEGVKRISLLVIIFFLISFAGDVFSACCSGLMMTKNFMLVLIPVFTGVVSFTGNAAAALSFNTVVFAFAEAVAVFFETVFPVLCVVLTAVSCAGAFNPVIKLNSIGSSLSKLVNLLMAFVAGIFVAVISVRGVIAGAADTVTIRGIRFLVGNALPVVGSAIGEALNSIVAGLSLIKNTVGVIGIAAVAVMNLPVLINACIWKGALYFIGFAGDITDFSEVKSFCENMNGVLSVIIGAICYVSFVFIISIAIILTVSKG